MNKITKLILIIITILVIVGTIMYPKLDLFKPDSLSPSSQSSGGETAHKLMVLGVVAKPDLLENVISVTGEIIANESIDLRTEMSGKIQAIYFEEGQAIRKGQLLVKINVDELKAQLEKVKFMLKHQETSENRQRQLLEREAISQEEYDEALTDLQTIGADVKLLETQIDKSEIRAPFDGIVGLKEVSVGEYIIPSNVIAPFYNINPAKIEFSIPGKYSNRIQKGSTISFTVESSERSFTGKVYAVEKRLNLDTRTITLRALCPNPQHLLLPGQFTRVKLVLDKKENALMVPTQAVIPELNGKKLFIYKNGVVAETQVETGLRTETDVEIINGLAPMDTVITSGLLQIRLGMPVNVNL